jgi:lipid II:glycine glycyltransferase (peptidoglycan interpeptide bridge formation enzyme)
MNITKIDPFSIEEVDRALIRAPSSFLQTPFWAQFKACHGWEPYYFKVSGLVGADGEFESFLLTVLVRPFLRLASIAYIPLGPDVSSDNPEKQSQILAELSIALKAFIPKNSICVRFDPPWGSRIANACVAGSEEQTDLLKAASAAFPKPLHSPAKMAPAHIQPPDTVILDLSLPQSELLAQMKSKWRYNIKLSEKKGVTIRYLDGEKGATEGVDIFYRLYIETAKRDGIAIHAASYYRDLIMRAVHERKTAYDKNVSVRVYVAEHEGASIASIITLFCGEEAVYPYGSSSNEKRNLMPTYSLQWKAICDAKESGCTRYDFYGMSPTDDPSHPMHGLYRFKTGFGGSIIHRVGSYDLPLRPILYQLYRFAESGRALWFKKIVKMLRRETPRKS